MFAVSGIILNHRNTYGKINVSRKYLPSKFQYTNWNNGLLRGTICWGDSILVYGAGGIYLTDSLAEDYYDFNAGLPESADSRNIRSIVQTPDGHLFAVAPYDLYTYTDSVWTNMSLGNQSEYVIHNSLCRVVAKKARQEHPVRDILDRLKMLHSEHIAKNTRIAHIPRAADRKHTVAQSFRTNQFQHLVRRDRQMLPANQSVIHHTEVSTCQSQPVER